MPNAFPPSQDGIWGALEAYIEEERDARVTHGMCPDCAKAMRELAG